MWDARARTRARRWAVAAHRHFGWACLATMGVSAACASAALASGSCVALMGWGLACAAPWSSDFVKKWAKGTRAPRLDLFERMRARQSAAFRALGTIEQARAAREDPSIQRRFWWEASAVMWMISNPGQEHMWKGMLASPSWFDDAQAWREETVAKLEQAADQGWICPSANVAWLLGQPERSASKKELGDAIEGFAALGDPWPAKARFCDTLASMGHKLYGKGFAEALAWRSHGALERLSICSDMESLGGQGLRSGRRLRL